MKATLKIKQASLSVAVDGKTSKIAGIAYLQEILHMLYFFLGNFQRKPGIRKKHSDEVKNKGKTE
jgi:hypothetical protein